jgi:multisubunit Na+/H+ antiporter MnhF subunit
MPIGAMTLGGYDIPMINTFMPFILFALFCSTAKIIIGRMWQDKDVNPKKLVLLAISIGLAFIIILYLGDVINWVWEIVLKVMSLVKTIKFK